MSEMEAYRAQRIKELVEDGAGFWRACSGCQEGVDGHVSAKDYPFDPTFRAQPGGGCSECGGIGVIWDNTDWSDFGEFAREELARTAAPADPAQGGA